MLYLDILKNKFTEKNSKNSSYSLRAFARDLNFNSGVMSSILNKNRTFPKNRIEETCNILKIDGESRKLFRSSVYLESLNIANIYLEMPSKVQEITNNHQLIIDIINDKDYFLILNFIKLFSVQVEELAILTNMDLKLLKNKVSVLKCLSIITECSNMILHYEKDKFKTNTTSNNIKLLKKETISNSILRSLDAITKKDKLQEFHTCTLVLSKTKLKKAKNLIREFLNCLTSSLEDETKGENDSIFEINLHLFQIYEKVNKEENIISTNNKFQEY